MPTLLAPAARSVRHEVYLAAGFRWEDFPSRVAVEVTLYFGAFADEAAAKLFWAQVVKCVNEQPSRQVSIPRLRHSVDGVLRVERRQEKTLGTLRDRHAVSELSPASLLRLNQDFKMEIVDPESVYDASSLTDTIIDRVSRWANRKL